MGRAATCPLAISRQEGAEVPTAPLPAPTVAEPPPKEKEKEEAATSLYIPSSLHSTIYLVVFSHQSISPYFTKHDNHVVLKNEMVFCPCLFA